MQDWPFPAMLKHFVISVASEGVVEFRAALARASWPPADMG